MLLGSPMTCCSVWDAAGGAVFLPAAPLHKQYHGNFPLVTVMQGNCSITCNKLQLLKYHEMVMCKNWLTLSNILKCCGFLALKETTYSLIGQGFFQLLP